MQALDGLERAKRDCSDNGSVVVGLGSDNESTLFVFGVEMNVTGTMFAHVS